MNMTVKFYKTFAILMMGFIGGSLSPWVMGWIRSITVPEPGDAVSIANTYIVFTTIIFVGVTLVVAIAGYVFSQQFAASKRSQENQIIEELREQIKTDEKLGIKLASAIIENTDASHYIDKLISSKIDELIQEKKSDAERNASAIQSISRHLAANGDKKNGSRNQ